MKKISSIVVLLWISFAVTAQDYVPTQADIEQFYKTKTLIVKEDNPLSEYNLALNEIISKEWKLTPFEFIEYKDFEEKRKNPEYSFLMLHQVRFDLDETKAVFNFITLILGGKEEMVQKMPELCAIPVSYRGVDEDSYGYKLATLLRFIQNHVEFITKNPGMISSNVFKHYNDNMGDIRKKTLYVIQSELASDINTEQKFKALYPFKFKITTKDEIEKAIEQRDENVVFLHKVGPEGTKFRSRCYKIIIGASDAQFYYFNYHKINVNKNKPDGLMSKDLKTIAKKAKKAEKAEMKKK